MFGTTRGERVSSKSEVIIADLLRNYELEGQLSYEYEQELFAPEGGAWDFRLPDFTVKAVGSAKAFLATLDGRQQAAVVLPLNKDTRSKWSNLPNGAAGFDTIPWSSPIMPVSSASLTRRARFRSLV